MKKIYFISFPILFLLFIGCVPSSQENQKDLEKVKNSDTHLSRHLLEESLSLGTQFLLNNQTEEGNFHYEYNFLTKKFKADDNQVRQAGALWGIALIHKENPSKATKQALGKGFQFFQKISKDGNRNQKYIVYPEDNKGATGTVALVSLSLIEFLQTDLSTEEKTKYRQELDAYIQFLLTLRKENGQFYSRYDFETGKGFGNPSPYFDGEALLALVKAAKYAGYESLSTIVMESAENMYEINVVEALQQDPDSKTTKGFYQWGSMSFYEIYTAQWDGYQDYAKRTIDLAYWMIDIHRTLSRPRNTAYAYEGLISAWELARLTHNVAAMEKIGAVIEKGLLKLTSWQVGSSIENIFLRRYSAKNPKKDSFAYGGVMNHKSEPGLRIDVTQHQMHAVILALELFL